MDDTATLTPDARNAKAATRVVHASCTICEAACGIGVHLRGGRVVRIDGDAADPFSRGHVCPKAVAMLGLQEDPHRLRRPMIRRGSRWEAVSWHEALDAAAEGLLRVKSAHGAQATGVYRGNPAIHDAGTLLSAGVIQNALGSRQSFSAGSLDTWPRFVQCTEMYGSPIRIPVPDIDRTDWFLVLGANPAVSQGSVMTAPGIRERLRALRARGGKLVVVDPRRTETAALADEHHFIRPGTDAAFMLAMAHVLLHEDGGASAVRMARLAGMLEGLDTLRDALHPLSPERVAPACGIEAATIRRLARAFAAAPRAVAYGRMGTSVQAFGALACWAIDLLAILTGNLDRPGGLMWARPAAPMAFAFEGAGLPVKLGRWASRAGREERFGDLPITALAEEIEAPGEGRLRALVTIAGNPVHTAPNSARLDRALAGLDFMVSLDCYLNETTRHANVILPPCGPLQRDHYDVLLMHVAVRNVAKWSPAALPRGDDEPDGWACALELGRRLLGLREVSAEAFDATMLRRIASGALASSAWKDTLPLDELVAAVGPRPGVARAIDAMLRVGPWGDACGRRPGGLSLAVLAAQPHGVDLGALEPALPGVVATARGRIALAPARMLADLPRLLASLAPAAQGAPLQLINRRDIRSMNSWLHNLPMLAKGRDRCTLLIHPHDARVRGIADAARVTLRSRVGALVAVAEVTDAVMPGVVCLPHGFGHQGEGLRMPVAQSRGGVNVNIVSDDECFDAASGAIALFGGPVEVEVSAPVG